MQFIIQSLVLKFASSQSTLTRSRISTLLENEHFTLVLFYVLASFVLRVSMFLRREPAISDFCMKFLYERMNKYTESILIFNCKLACDLDQLKHWKCHIANGFESKEKLNIFRSQKFKKEVKLRYQH